MRNKNKIDVYTLYHKCMTAFCYLAMTKYDLCWVGKVNKLLSEIQVLMVNIHNIFKGADWVITDSNVDLNNLNFLTGENKLTNYIIFYGAFLVCSWHHKKANIEDSEFERDWVF